MSYYLAPSLVALRDEVNARWPGRSKASDGWIGDTSHSARKSDHNPDWDAGGVVRAIDVTKAGIDMGAFLAAVIGDPRVWYVIHDGHIYSRTYGWERRRYTGANKHTIHAHVSIRHGRAYETDTSRWLAAETPKDWFTMATKDELREVIRDEVPALVRAEIRRVLVRGKRVQLPGSDKTVTTGRALRMLLRKVGK
jgi:hypothetical protein